MSYLPFIIFGVVLGIINLLTRKYPKLDKLNKRLNARNHNNHNDDNDNKYLNLDDKAAGMYLQHNNDD
ncbi:MAG: hypothetical protein EVJ46_00030 [Candidatus Acididesulfobacter guangdongensis]|uniref:Uncharacterized protein n=1 Tax=Acididesulfobacter guangdongensis TaxID=2597225 RepID=A0A519BHC5_ACIG2|nr:MAG: hypothetical protein EVJ46_00030 [Candidatus Acididesulfobacter guangdongensis]